MPETDLYAPVKRLLEQQGFEVKGEIGGCDAVACRGAEPPVIVELKSAFNLKLVLQGIDRQAVSDAVYLAIPEPKYKASREIKALLKRLGLGLITVHRGIAEAVLDPAPYAPRKNKRRKEMLLREFAHRRGDPNAGGSVKTKLITAYRQDALRLLKYLAASGPSKTAALRQETQVARAQPILQDDVYGWFYRESRGVYGVTGKGRAALEDFAAAAAGL